MKIALITNNLNHHQNKIFTKSDLIEENLTLFLNLVKTKLELLGGEFNTYDIYKEKNQITMFLFLDYPVLGIQKKIFKAKILLIKKIHQFPHHVIMKSKRRHLNYFFSTIN